jgi:hypothetical protein
VLNHLGIDTSPRPSALGMHGVISPLLGNCDNATRTCRSIGCPRTDPGVSGDPSR